MKYAHADYISEDVRITFCGTVETNGMGVARRHLVSEVTDIEIVSVEIFGTVVNLEDVPPYLMEKFMEEADHVEFETGGH